MKNALPKPVIYKKRVEQRRYKRINLSSPWRTLVRFREENLEAVLIDLSKGGALIRVSLSRPSMSAAIQQGFEINLTIPLIVFLPSGKKSHFNATIRWVQRFADAYIMGLQVIDTIGKTLIAEMVDDILKKQQKEKTQNET